MQINILEKIVDYYRVWSKIPDIPVVEIPSKKVTQEEYSADYTENQLRTFVKSATDLFGGMVIDHAAVDALPDNYLLSIYENLRFGKIPTETLPVVMFVGTEAHYSGNAYALPQLILASAMINQMYAKETNTTDPYKQWRSRNLRYIAIHVHAAIINILQDNPTGIKPDLTVVSAYSTEYGEGEETIIDRFVYIDRPHLKALEPKGWTAQSIAEHWVTEHTQPM